METRSLVALVSIAFLMPLGFVTASNPADVDHACQGEISAPLEVHIVTPEGVRPGTELFISGSVELKADAPELTISFQALGPVTILGPPIVGGPYFAGETVPFKVAVAYRDFGKAAVHVLAEVGDGFGTALTSHRDTLYTLINPARTLTGHGGFMALELKAIEDNTGRTLTAETAESARRELVRMTRSTPGDAIKYAPLGEDLQRFNALVGLPPRTYGSAAEGDSRVLANITIQGDAAWQDENGDWHPVFGATIEIWDEETLFDDFITAVVTDVNGHYVASVNDDDGIGQGDRDIYVRYLTANGWVNCKNLSDDTYFAESGVHDETPGGTTITEDFFFAAGGIGDSNSVFQAGTWISAYIAGDAEAFAFPQIDLVWPNGDTKSFYDGAVNIEEPDRYDWDTIHHEYGHYAMDRLNTEDNPGGPHNIGDCITDVHGDDKSEGNRLAWGEGWPTYFALSAQAELNLAALNVPRVGDDSYQDIEDGSVVYSIESQDNNGRGEDNELAVQRLLWDLYDSNSDSRDNISRTDNSIWNTIKAAAGSPHILSNYWTALRSGQTDQTNLLMGEIASDHQIGPRLNTPLEGALVTPSSKTFSWQAAVGCPSSYDGDSFDLVFYNQGTFVKILTVPGLSNTSYSLSLAELGLLATATHDVLWAIEGRHSPGPSTGPYLGESFAVTVDRPPVADANGPYETHEGTDVVLDGMGSIDPDGDLLTYEWDLDNDGFYDDATGPTPTFSSVGQDGIFVVGLRVTDPFGLSDTNSTTVTVLNVAPSVSLASNAPKNENTAVMVSGIVSDPGWLDILTATIDWGDGSPVEPGSGVLENVRPDATLAFGVSHVYGDNGSFLATVCGFDDDAVTCATILLQIDNVNPTAEIDESGAVLVNGMPTFLAHAGEPLDFSGRSTDPGSDDLALSWDWDDGSPVVTTLYLVNPPNPDPLPSPSIQPRDVTDLQTYSWTDACLYEIEFWAMDDDSGMSPVDAASVVIVGNADRVRSAGYWQHQFRVHLTNNGRPQFDQATLECYLAITGYMSLVFDEVTDASTLELAFDVLVVKQNDGSMLEIFDRQLLAVWLNFANGTIGLDELIDSDGDGVVDTSFHDIVDTAEAVRLNPGSAAAEIEEQKDILERINESHS